MEANFPRRCAMALPEFHNEPLTDFSADAGRTAMQQALRTVAAQLGKEFPLIIGGQRVTTKDKFNSYNPSLKDEVVAVCQKAAADHVQTAVAAAEKAWASWSRVPAEERAAILLRAADWLRRRKFVASAWQIYEVGKNWGEADADVAETIDHLEFFAREALRYARGQVLAPHPQEFSEYTYLPLGVVAVIPPWNFPLAIPVGMASAAIATGNTVVMNPARTRRPTPTSFWRRWRRRGCRRESSTSSPGPAAPSVIPWSSTRGYAWWRSPGARTSASGCTNRRRKCSPGSTG